MRLCTLASNGTQDNAAEYVLSNPSFKWSLVQNSNEDFYASLIKRCINLDIWTHRLLQLYLVMPQIFSVTTELLYFQTAMSISLHATSKSTKQWGNFSEVQRRYIWRGKSNIYDFQCDLNSGCVIHTRCPKNGCTKTVNHITVITFIYVQFFTCNNWQHCGYTSSSFYHTCPWCVYSICVLKSLNA
jgi:hypothetical protein